MSRIRPMYTAPNNYFNERPGLWEALRLPLRFLAALWVIHSFQDLFNIDFGNYGILPHEIQGLRGILFAPLLHADWSHIASNSLPFLIFASVVNYFFPRVAFRAFLWIYFATGILVWVFARGNSYHIGASYLVYGLASFIFFTGIFRRSIRSIVLSLLIMTFYSGLAAGIVPNQEHQHISWESHLLGAIVGAIIAWRYRNDYENDEINDEQPVAERTQSFFQSDTFDKTKAEREAEALAAEEAQRQAEQPQNPPNNGWSGWWTNHTGGGNG